MKISCKLILGFSQRSKFAMSLQYLKKEVRDEIEVDHAFKNQSFLQFGTIIIYGYDQAFSKFSQ